MNTTIKDGNLDIRQVRTEPLKLMTYLSKEGEKNQRTDHPTNYIIRKKLKQLTHQQELEDTWYANSLVWHRTRAITWPDVGSICWRVDKTNTAVFPIPDLAWQMTSMPKIAWGIHSCWTDEEPNKIVSKEPLVSKIKPPWSFNWKVYQTRILLQNQECDSGILPGK